MIIKGCIKNMLKSLKYYFVPFGISVFFIIIALYVGIPIITGAIQTTFNNISTELGGMEFNWNDAWSAIITKVGKIDFGQGADGVINTVTDRDWLVTSLKDVAVALFGDQAAGSNINKLINGCVDNITTTISYIVVMAVIGFVVSFFVIMVVARKSIQQISWPKTILFSLIDTALFIFFVWLFEKINVGPTWSRVLVNLIYVLGVLVISLIEAYFFYGYKKLKVKEVFQAKNTLLFLGGSFLALLIGVAITLIPYLCLSGYFGLILCIPLVEIVLLVLHINIESYVKGLADRKEKKQHKAA